MFEALLKYPREAYQTGELTFSNVLDPTLWYLVAGAALLTLLASVMLGKRTRALAWWQQTPIALLQALVVLGVLTLLAGPALKTTTLQPGANAIAVLIDTSASMGFPDAPGSAESRLDKARTLLEQTLEPMLAELGELTFFTFDETAVRRQEPQLAATEANTHLLAATDSVLASFQGMPLAAVIVLSDGADNDPASGLDPGALARHGVPVHTVGFGPLDLPGEVELSEVELPADAPPNSRVSASLMVSHSNAGEAIVKVRDGTTLLAAERITLPEDSPRVRTEIGFDAGATGIRELTFELETPAGDVLPLNNSVQRLLTVNERKRRVLYLEGEPRWEYKFLRRAVAGDEVLELVSWLRTTDNKTYRQGVTSADELAGGFPADKATLYGYDVVVLGSLAATTLTDAQHDWLEAFVAERGGSLLALAGRESLADGGWDVQPLAGALPVVLERSAGATYRAAAGRALPTRAGRASPLTRLVDAEGLDAWASLPELGDLQLLGALKPAATTLLELHQGEDVYPLLVTQPYGLGTAAVLATATTWRWQMRTPPNDPRHAIFWRQLLRQLAESAQQQRTVDLAVGDDGIQVRAWIRDDEYAPDRSVTATATVTAADRSTRQLNLIAGNAPGMLTADYQPAAAGVYRVDVAISNAGVPDPDSAATETITRFVRTGAEHREYFSPVRNEALLRRISAATGGAYRAPADVEDLATMLRFSMSGIRITEVLPLWNLPVFFVLLLMLKLIEWALRRWWGRI